MFKKFLFLISFVLVLSLASAGYGDGPTIKVDFDAADDVNTEAGFTSFTLLDSGSEVNDVNGNPSGVIIDLGGTLDDARRDDPNSNNDPVNPIPIIEEEVYRDFIYGLSNNPVTITLWGLGAGRECKIYIYTFDDGASGVRIANWTANGAYLLTAEFEGDNPDNWPSPWWPYGYGHQPYDFNGIGHADEFGRIFLTCTQGAGSASPYAYVNALVVIPYGDYNDVEEAHRPQPADGQEGVPVDTVLSWIPGAYVVEHDVYFGTDETPTYQDTVGTPSYDPPGFLELDQTYYWRVNEVNGLDIWPGEVWSFTTSPYFALENFNSYEDTDALVGDDAWKYWEGSTDTCAYLDLVKTGDPSQRPVRDGNSMEYEFKNQLNPHYSVAKVDIADLPGGSDAQDWLGINVKSLALWFYGQEGNPVSERMYVRLTDGDSPPETAKVSYGVNDPKEDMNDIKVEEWQEWNIALDEFLADNPDVNLANVATIAIGFGDGSSSNHGIVYFEDIIIHTTRCVLVEREDDFALVDFAPGGIVAGDCMIDYQELQVIARTWLAEDSVIDTNNPGTDNLVGYYPFDDFKDANSFAIPDEIEDIIFANSDSNDINGVMLTQNMAPSPHPNSTWGILSPIDPCDDRETEVTWVTPGIQIQTDPCVPPPDGNAAHFDSTLSSSTGNRIAVGSWNPIGNFNATDPNGSGVYARTGDLSLAIWAKWGGPHPLRDDKCQGLISKRRGWGNDEVLFMFECDTTSAPRGSFSLRQYNSAYSVWTDAGILDSFIGKWVHLAATYHGSDSNIARLYLNGAEVQNGPFYFGGKDPNFVDMTIGQISDIREQSIENFHGDLDEARIYNRALSASEIAYLADTTPYDGKLERDVPSAAEVYKEELVGSRIINFKDFALITDMWLEEDLWP